MYEEYFKLKTKPFELVPNPDFLYLSKSHKKALTFLEYGINANIGFILMTGEVGSGKTTLLKDLIKKLNGNVKLSKVFNTKVNSEQLIALINEDFGLEVTGKDKVTMLRDLNDFLIDQHADRGQPILIIDEAQNLNAELLEEIRMLSNLETNVSKLLQIVMIGQPELKETLALPKLRQLRQRISISCHIQHLTREETEEYVYHRLEKAGGRKSVYFHGGTMDVVYKFSRGIPRLVNIICDYLLLTAFSTGTKDITREITDDVAEELERENSYWQDDVTMVPGEPGNDGEISDRLKRVEENLCHVANNKEKDLAEDNFRRLENDMMRLTSQLRSQLWELDVKVRTMAKDFIALKKEITTKSDGEKVARLKPLDKRVVR